MTAANVRQLRPRRVNVRAPSPEQAPLFPRAAAVVLQPIPWGKRDAELARGICHHIVHATPPTVIPFDPGTDRALRSALQSRGISTDKGRPSPRKPDARRPKTTVHAI